ncbi:head-tail connector protein [Aliarcobacter lanthieri]|uniref:head-tail connector protein n=1 Tax=Aliarcobacter lanthieri TaxID=1355374 RepID=UPI003AADD8A6
MNIVQIIAPIKEPLTLEDAKNFMHILEDDEDTLIETFISSAREYAENYTNRQFEKATYELYINTFIQDMKMPKNPISSIEKIEFMDIDGNYEELEKEFYYLYGENDIFKIHFESFKPHKTHKQAVKITFIAGYDEVPKSILQALKIYVATLYENREQYVIDFNSRTNVTEVPIVQKMLSMYRVQPI